MAITLGTNINSLRAQRQLSQATDLRAKSMLQLSSGMRINTPSDDAAGFAISTNLKLQGRIATQGIRNLNDGISAITIMSSAMSSLTDIATRISELAESAANGTYSSNQRASLNTEAQQLRLEFNRVIQTTKFNQQNLLYGSNSTFTIEGGTGGQTNVGLRSAVVSTQSGTGSFAAVTTYSGAGSIDAVATGDFNGDGNLDFLTTDNAGGKIRVYLGNGDGAFQAPVSYVAVASGAVRRAIVADFNGDGKSDIAAVGQDDNAVNILFGTGSGTFSALVSYSTSSIAAVDDKGITTGDFNSDGVLDLAVTSGGGGLHVLIGNSNGSFRAAVTYAQTFDSQSVATIDLNGDSILDLVALSQNSDSLSPSYSVYLGNGNGTFRAPTSYQYAVGATNMTRFAIGDINGDGSYDLVSGTRVLLGNADGSFNAFSANPGMTGQSAVHLSDLDGDGNLDLVDGGFTTGSSSIGVALGNGDGTFRVPVSTAMPGSSGASAIGDFNHDGATDFIVAYSGGGNGVAAFMANPSGLLTTFSLLTASSAREALTIASQTLSDLNSQNSLLGAQQARLQTQINMQQIMRENYAGADARIADLDYADAVATSIKATIQQQVTTGILAQANLQPELALTLLRNI